MSSITGRDEGIEGRKKEGTDKKMWQRNKDFPLSAYQSYRCGGKAANHKSSNECEADRSQMESAVTRPDAIGRVRGGSKGAVP